MKLLRLKAKNFLSIKDVELDLNNQGLTLIKGINKDNSISESNGAGKSSILEAIVYALYGKTVKGLTGDAVIHNKAKKDMMVSLEIEGDSKAIYKLVRYRKDSEYKNKFFLYLNGNDVTPKSEKDFTEKINNILHMDYSTFTASVLYTAQSFTFTSSSDTEIKKSFDKMLNLDVLSKSHEEVKEEIKIIKNNTLNLKEEEKFTKVYLEESKTNIKDYKEQVTSLELLLQEDERNRDKIVSEETKACKNITNKIKELEENYSSVEVTLNKWKAKDARSSQPSEVTLELQDKLKDIKEDTQAVEEKKENFEIKLKKCTHYLENLKLDKEREERILNEKIKAKEDIKEVCPYCNQPLKEEQIKETIANANKEIEKQNTKIKSIEDDYINYSDKKEKFKSKLEKCKTLIEDLNSEKEEIESLLERDKQDRDNKNKDVMENIQKYTEELHEVKLNLMSSKKDLDMCKKKLAMADDLNKQIEQKKKNIEKFKQKIEEIKTKVVGYKETLDRIKETLKKYTDDLECLEFWKNAFSNQGIKSLILEDIVPFLNKRANSYLCKLSEGIEVNFTTQTKLKSGEVKDKFNIEIKNKYGGTDYASNSSGEKKRVDIAINLALQDLIASRSINKINISFYDEVFDGLDEVGINAILDLLQEVSKEKDSIFVISHNPHIQDVFDHVITITKENGYSFVK